MSKVTVALLWLISILLMTSCTGSLQTESLPSPSALHFSQTGNTVQGDFLGFFQNYGGEASLGVPLTSEIIVDDWRVQYFENGRLEWHPENEPAYRITVGWLGDLLQRRQPPLPLNAIPRADDRNRRYFPETGHTLSGDFLTYFDKHGGSVRFGQPISEPFIKAGQLTQDFQSARFFWTPDQESPVTLEPIGKTHLATLNLAENSSSK